MNTFECLEDEACKNGIDIVRRRFNSPRIKGLCCDGMVAISEDVETSVECSCILAEELGHHYTTVGNILDLSKPQNRKQERQARLWAYNRLIGLRGLISAYEHGYNKRHEIAEYLEVTEEFLEDAIQCYREKYGVCICIDNYVISFIPKLAMSKKV